jgi:hypothetical protein
MHIEHLQKKFPRSKFKTTSEWAEAVKNEIILVLAPQIESFRRELGPRFPLLQSAATLEQDVTESALATEERLDAMIERAIKRLVQAKAAKQML